MRIIISAGGTGGHIYPALAIINKIKEEDKNSEILYIGTHNRMENDIIPKLNIPFETIEVYGLSKSIKKNIKTLKCFFKATKKCKKIIKNFNPDIVVGAGGYVTAPLLYAAHTLKYKTAIHEQNSIPGKANLFIANFADTVMLSFKSSAKYFKNKHPVFTGNPCSSQALRIKPCEKKEFGLTENKKLVLIVMGSLGAQKVNEEITKAFNDFTNKDYEVLFVTGKNNYENINSIKHPRNVKVLPYIENLTKVMKKSDIIVSRAGASTLSEIIALKKPSILIPSPYVPNNHQYINAMDLVNNKSALLIEEKDLNKDILIKQIDELLKDEKKIKDMKKNLQLLDVNDSVGVIYNNLKQLIDRK